jgi:hypothetical protein
MPRTGSVCGPGSDVGPSFLSGDAESERWRTVVSRGCRNRQRTAPVGLTAGEPTKLLAAGCRAYATQVGS